MSKLRVLEFKVRQLHDPFFFFFVYCTSMVKLDLKNISKSRVALENEVSPVYISFWIQIMYDLFKFDFAECDFQQLNEVLIGS